MNHDYYSSFEDIELRPMTEKDSEKYRVLRNDSEVRKFFEYNKEISQAEQSEWYKNYLEKSDEIMLSIYKKNEEIFLGCNSLYRIDFGQKKAEYGRIIIDKRYSGKQYGYMATKAIIKIAFEKLNLSEIVLEVYSDNNPAIISYQKAGFKEVDEKLDFEGRKMILMSISIHN